MLHSITLQLWHYALLIQDRVCHRFLHHGDAYLLHLIDGTAHQPELDDALGSPACLLANRDYDAPPKYHLILHTTSLQSVRSDVNHATRKVIPTLAHPTNESRSRDRKTKCSYRGFLAVEAVRHRCFRVSKCGVARGRSFG